MALPPLLVLLTGVLLLLIFPGAEAREVGVSYGRVANNTPDPVKVVQLLKQNGITMVRLYDADPGVLRALANTGIKVMVMMPNKELASAATSWSYALEWAKCNVSKYYPKTLINGVAVGNEVFVTNPRLTRLLLPAMTNVQRALAKLGLADAVKFLQGTGSYLSMNPYPFFAYAEDPQNIHLDYALGNSKTGVPDNNTGLVYHSLLDAMMEATYYAMENLTGHINVMQSGRGGGSTTKTKLTESSWPHDGSIKSMRNSQRYNGSPLEASNGFQPATVANAKAYNNYLINRVLCGHTGTPHRPQADMDVYIFALFNENRKGFGPADVEQHFGLFSLPGMKKMYEFDFHGNGTSGGGGSSEVSWCVSKAGVGDERLKEALNWACSHGADCSDTKPGAGCFEPNTMAAHASHAFNSYYQRQHRASGSCNFKGAASVVYQEPRIGNCVLPSKP